MNGCLTEQSIQQQLPGYSIKISRGEGMLGIFKDPEWSHSSAQIYVLKI